MEGDMNDLQGFEIMALEYAGQMGGEYLDSIGKTDLATLTQDEWKIFIQCVCLNFTHKRIELDGIPF
jgi:hypothetical protein